MEAAKFARHFLHIIDSVGIGACRPYVLLTLGGIEEFRNALGTYSYAFKYEK